MGCDIHGAIEAAHPDHYTRYLAPLGGFVGRNYSAFGCLFGVRNYDQFDPLFAERGFPDDVAWRTEDAIEDWGGEDAVENPTERIDFHGFSYATLPELEAVDWDEEADAPSQHYTLLDENMESVGGFGMSSSLEGFIRGHEAMLATGEPVKLPDDYDHGPARMLYSGDPKFIQRRQKTRLESIAGAWEWLIFELMPMFADRFEDRTIRLVVWFDN